MKNSKQTSKRAASAASAVLCRREHLEKQNKN